MFPCTYVQVFPSMSVISSRISTLNNCTGSLCTVCVITASSRLNKTLWRRLLSLLCKPYKKVESVNSQQLCSEIYFIIIIIHLLMLSFIKWNTSYIGSIIHVIIRFINDHEISLYSQTLKNKIINSVKHSISVVVLQNLLLLIL